MVVLGLCLAMGGCGGKAVNLKPVDASMGVWQAGEGNERATITFYQDGTLTMADAAGKISITGTWARVDKDNITFNLQTFLQKALIKTLSNEEAKAAAQKGATGKGVIKAGKLHLSFDDKPAQTPLVMDKVP